MSFVVEVTEKMNIVEYLMEHVNEVVSEKELLKVAPRNGRDILDMLKYYQVVESTEGGLFYKDSKVDELWFFLQLIEEDILTGTSGFELNVLLTRVVSLKQANGEALAKNYVMSVAEPPLNAD